MAYRFDNRYETIRRLGSGGMADVYLARDIHLGRDVAIKILHQRFANNDEFVARFRREAQSAAGLNHPLIVSIYDRGEAEGSHYIAMEYLEGSSLKEVIARGRLEPRLAIDIAAQILQALKFAHEHHVIHRDIKPQNIIFDGRHQAKVTDFGIARAGSASRITETGSIIGTVQYLSPEQAKGQAVQQGSDLYSVGVVLYEMLTGKVPFEGENPVATALKHLNEKPAPPQALVPEIPGNLNTVVMRALAKDPLDRYASAEEFLTDLKRCRQDLPVAASALLADSAKTAVIAPAAIAIARPSEATAVRPAPASRGSSNGKRSRRWLWVLLALLAAVPVAVGIFLLAVSQNGGAIAVPSAVGMPLGPAQDIVRSVGLNPVTGPQQFSDMVPAGNVISQNPDAGTRLEKGGAVRLVISKGRSPATVPANLVGQSAGFVEAKLREAGLQPNRQPDAYSDNVPEGNVIAVDPASGISLQTGSPVNYVVSKGQAPPQRRGNMGHFKDS